MQMKLRLLLCKLGLHKWKEDLSKRQPIKAIGMHFLFFSSAIQKGGMCCQRCGETKKVFRTAWYGIDTDDSKIPWQKMSAATEKYIDSLPSVI
jgi:hypothetical protein